MEWTVLGVVGGKQNSQTGTRRSMRSHSVVILMVMMLKMTLPGIPITLSLLRMRKKKQF